MSSLHHDLWNIFTYYSLRGNPKDPSILAQTGFIKFCRDIKVMSVSPLSSPSKTASLSSSSPSSPLSSSSSSATSVSPSYFGNSASSFASPVKSMPTSSKMYVLNPVELNIIITQELRRANGLIRDSPPASPVAKASSPKQTKTGTVFVLSASSSGATSANAQYKHLTFEIFNACLLKIALKCYSNENSPQHALKLLLLNNIKPFALRRKPLASLEDISDPSVDLFLSILDNSFREIFEFYCLTSDINTKKLHISSKDSQSVFGGPAIINKSTNANGAFISMADAIVHISYDDFIRFLLDFGLINGFNLTTVLAGDVYLSCLFLQKHIDKKQPLFSVRNIKFEDFRQIIVLLAHTAYNSKAHAKVPLGNKVRGFILDMWKHLQITNNNFSTQVNTTTGAINANKRAGELNSYKSKFVLACREFNSTFLDIWANDSYCDYMTAQNQKKNSLSVDTSGDSLNQSSVVDDFSSILDQLAQDPTFDFNSSNTFSSGLFSPSSNIFRESNEGVNSNNYRSRNESSNDNNEELDFLIRNGRPESKSSSSAISLERPSSTAETHTTSSTTSSIGTGTGSSELSANEIVESDGIVISDVKLTLASLKSILNSKPELAKQLVAAINEA